jgi:hypothetical protein
MRSTHTPAVQDFIRVTIQAVTSTASWRIASN